MNIVRLYAMLEEFGHPVLGFHTYLNRPPSAYNIASLTGLPISIHFRDKYVSATQSLPVHLIKILAQKAACRNSSRN